MSTNVLQREKTEEKHRTGMTDPVRYFETTVVSSDGSLSAHLFAIPRSCLPKNYEAMNAPSVSELLGFSMLDAVASPSSLPYALAATLLSANPDEVARAFRGLLKESPETVFTKALPPSIALFAQQIAFEKMVPMESSPIDLHSIASLITGGSAVGAGLAIGLTVAAGHPILLVTAPIGIVLVVAAPEWGKKVGEIGSLLLDKVIAIIKK